MREKNPARLTTLPLSARCVPTAHGSQMRTAYCWTSTIPTPDEQSAFPLLPRQPIVAPLFPPPPSSPPQHLYAWRDNDTLLSRTHTGRFMIRKKFWNSYAKSVHSNTHTHTHTGFFLLLVNLYSNARNVRLRSHLHWGKRNFFYIYVSYRWEKYKNINVCN